MQKLIVLQNRIRHRHMKMKETEEETKIMRHGKQLRDDIDEIEEYGVREVDGFKYLAILTSNGGRDTEIEEKIRSTNEAIYAI